MGILFILLYLGFEKPLIWQKLIFSLADRANFENKYLRILTSSNIKAWSKCLFREQQCLECKFAFALWATLESGYSVNAKHAQLESRSAHQLWLKAVDMLWSSTQLAKSHADDLGLEYLRNGDEYSSLENSFKSIEKNAEYRGQQEVLVSPSACCRETNHCSLWDSDKDTIFGGVLLIALA